VVVPGVLPFINFDSPGGGPVVYPADDPIRPRHLAWRSHFGELFTLARRRGFQVYLATDMFTLTPGLERYLRQRFGGLDAAQPGVWQTYAAGFDELFRAMPQVTGVVVRVGEGGALFNAPGWEYRSEFGVRTISGLRMMLHELLPVFERHGRTLVLRTWTVGSGELGDLHTNPATYDAALGDIDSPSLVVSTKFVRGDFYSFLPVNPTLRSGRHRRLVELQARPEYEGFGAFPNYLAALHRTALSTLRGANSRIVGAWLWTQAGGPLHAGPMSLYPLHGFWLWIDANVYASARLVRDPGADPTALADDWARRTFPRDTAAARAVATMLVDSRGAVERGLYIRPFAERQLRAFELEAPPMLWILEWNQVGGSSVVWTTIYRGVRDSIDAAIADGFAAVAKVRAMRKLLPPGDTGLTAVRRSLIYEESLVETLAWYRRAMLAYYRWLDTGDRGKREEWRQSSRRLLKLAVDHERTFGRDLDWPAYDFSAATATLRAASYDDLVMWAAGVVLVVILALLLWPRWANPPLTVGLLVATLALVTSGRSAVLLAAAALIGAVSWLVLERSWQHVPWRDHQIAERAVNMGVLGALLALVVTVAARGPGWLWFVFWSPGSARVALVTAVTSLLLLPVLYIAMRTPYALGGLLLSIGVAGIALSLVTPDLATMLTALDRPLGLVPMGTSFVHGALAYFDFPRAAPWYPAIVGLGLCGAGLILQRHAARLPPADPPLQEGEPQRGQSDWPVESQQTPSRNGGG
jgi:hypothetical protein